MNIVTSCLIVASLVQCSFGASLEIYFENMNKNAVNTEEAKPEPKDVFSFIAESNKDVKMLLREGDIVIGVGRNAKICEGNTCRWKANSDGIVNVPYTISTNFSAAEVSVIVDAMQDFALLTCVRFVPRTVEPDYVKIINGPGCWSSVGKTVGAQELSLDSNGCVTKGTAQHELNHALGFYHEQSRIDRDNYVKIITENILPGAIGNFDKRNTDNLGQEYDYASIMHYGRNAFAKQSNLNTIVPKPDPTVAIGQRYGLSNLDISKINKLYECGACSNVLSDTTGSLKSSNYPGIYPNNGTCLWLIRVPDGQVFMQFMAFDLQSSTGCASDYLKVYDGGTPSAPVLLAKACGTSQLPSIVSTGNLMLLEFVSDGSIAATGFKASYSTVQCGSAFYSPSGEFSTPNYPSDYPPNTNCSWIIWAPAGYQVSLNMADFYLEYHRSCSYDSLQVFDGPKSTSPLIGRYCTSIPNIVSTGNSLLLQFRSDRQVQNRGFKANYSFVPKKN